MIKPGFTIGNIVVRGKSGEICAHASQRCWPFLGLVSSVCECKNDAVKSALVDCIKLVYLLVDYCHVRALSSSCAMIDSSVLLSLHRALLCVMVESDGASELSRSTVARDSELRMVSGFLKEVKKQL